MDERTIRVYPSIGDAYRITLYIPTDRDEEEYVNEFLEDHAKNVDEWEWV